MIGTAYYSSRGLAAGTPAHRIPDAVAADPHGNRKARRAWARQAKRRAGKAASAQAGDPT